MKIIYLYQYFITPKKPGVTRAYELARRLVEMGHEVHMVTSDAGWMAPESRSSKKDWYQTNEDGIQVHWLSVPYSNRMGFAARLKAYFRFMFAASAYASKLDGDVVYATSSPLTIAIPGTWVARRGRIPMVFEVRDLWPEAAIQTGNLKNPVLCWLARRLERFAYRNAARIVALSPGMKEGIVQTGESPQKVEIIPNSSDLDFFHPGVDGSEVRKRLQWGDRCVFGYCGMMGDANGLAYVLDGAEAVSRRRREDILFVIFGDGKKKPELEEILAAKGLKNVCIYEAVEKSSMPEILAALDVSLVIFRNCLILRTCSPNKMFDAFAAGNPILTNMPGWMGELAEKEGTGYLADPESAEDFADKAIRMADDSEERIALGARSRALGEREFSRQVLAERLEKVLQSVVDKEGGA